MWSSGGGGSALHAWANKLSKALENCSYDEAGEVTGMLSLRLVDGDGSLAPIESPDQRQLESILETPWDAIAKMHLRVVWLLSQKDVENAFDVQTKLVQLMTREVIAKNKDENWFLPVVYKFCADLRLLAKCADRNCEPGKNPEGRSFLEQSASPIMDCYRSCQGDNKAAHNVSKRLAILNLTNQLFRIYFRINKLNLLKPLIRAVENCGQLYDYFSMADKVTYNYYLGRKAMFDANLDTAEKALSFAFKGALSADHPNNQRLILMFVLTSSSHRTEGDVRCQSGHGGEGTVLCL